jgi:N-acyl-D-aspartate/D-glutamate deacylase
LRFAAFVLLRRLGRRKTAAGRALPLETPFMRFFSAQAARKGGAAQTGLLGAGFFAFLNTIYYNALFFYWALFPVNSSTAIL